MQIGYAGMVVFGDNFHSGVGCKIITKIQNYEGDALSYDNKVIVKVAIFRDNVWFFDDVTVLGVVSFGNGAIIQTLLFQI